MKDGEVAQLYIEAFNAVFNRRCSLIPQTEKKISYWIKQGYKPWQLVAQPMIVAAQGIGPTLTKTIRPEIPLRDGLHPKTTQYGTCGGTDWMARAWEQADTTVFDYRLSEIAREFDQKIHGLIVGLVDMGVRLIDPQSEAERRHKEREEELRIRRMQAKYIEAGRSQGLGIKGSNGAL